MAIGDAWGAETSPSGFELQYLQAADMVAPGASQAANAERLPGESYIDALARVAQTYLLADSQRRLLNIQLQRAEQGLPPLNSAQYGIGASVNVGVAPDTQKTLLIGLGILAAVLVLPKLIR